MTQVKQPMILVILAICILLAGCIAQRSSYQLTLHVRGQGTATPDKVQAYSEATVVDIAALPARGWRFERWEGQVADPYASQTTVLVDGPLTVYAVFADISAPAFKVAPGGLISGQPRPGGARDIEYVMLHAISDAALNPANPYQIERIGAIFREYGVESHYVIDRDGTAYRFADDTFMARHAGRGAWGGDPRLTNNMNRYAVGIEIMGTGTAEEMAAVIGPVADSKISQYNRGYTEQQYAALNRLLPYLTDRYQIPSENIITHKEYDPARKWDPGALFETEKVPYLHSAPFK